MATWDLTETKHHILLCNGSSCNKAGAEELTQAVRAEIMARGLDHEIHTTRTRCNGRCQDKCVLVVYPDGTWYKDLKPEDASHLIASLSNNNENLTNKVAFQFNGVRFERTKETVIGEKNSGKGS
jgi:(2Fe-2S) ferredoxin